MIPLEKEGLLYIYVYTTCTLMQIYWQGRVLEIGWGPKGIHAFFFSFFKISFFKVISKPNSQPKDQESHALVTETARHHACAQNFVSAILLD